MGSDMLQRQGAGCGIDPSELYRCGKFDEAGVCVAKVLEEDPKHLGALEVRARLLWREGEVSSLLSTLDTLIEMNPYEPGYFALRGAALQSIGRSGDAIRAYERCIAMGGDHEDAKAQLETLTQWQTEEIEQLTLSDRVFAAAYAQDPRKACESRGFAYAASTRVAVVQAIQQATLTARPS